MGRKNKRKKSEYRRRLGFNPMKYIGSGARSAVNHASVAPTTTIVDGKVTSYTQVRVANGIIYPPLETEPDPGTGEEGPTDNTENSGEEAS